MWLPRLLGSWRATSAPAHAPRRRSASCRPSVERLEDRCLLAAVLLDINTSTLGSSPVGLTHVNGTLFFTASTPETGFELWKSDGTEAGTILVKDINPGSAGSAPQNLTNVGGTLFFTATTPGTGFELWKSDGTEAGTELVKDIRPGGSGSFPEWLTNAGDTLFFVANGGNELWRSDGTAAGTVLVQTIPVPLGTCRVSIEGLTHVNGALFYAVYGFETDPEFGGCDVLQPGAQLWRSDGTASGTSLVASLDSIGGFVGVGSLLFFSAATPETGLELWRTDGTAAGTGLVKDINPGAGGSLPIIWLNIDGTLFFTANDGVHGHELWKSDGTPEGTVLVKDIRPGSASSSPQDLRNVNGTLFFVLNEISGRGLWKSDGTEEGTVLVKDFRDSTSWLTNVSGTLFFAASAPGTGVELWQSDGTEEGTVLVQDINPGSAHSFPSFLTNVNGTLFFTALTPEAGRELWFLPPLAPPTGIESVAINDSSAQRSRVTSITVTFSGLVTFDPGAFELLRVDGSPVGLDAAAFVVDGRTVAVLTFTGDDILGGSLADGSYTLIIHGGLIHDSLGQEPDGDGDGLDGGDRVEAFFRLFGDSDGDGDVDGLDLEAFQRTRGLTYQDEGFLWFFDFDGDGDVDEEVDGVAFQRRLVLEP